MWKQRICFLCAAALALFLLWDRTEPVLPVEGAAALTEETKYIAITFDDGPRRDTTTRLLDGLKERGASATFFLMGSQIEGNEDLVLRMKREGHQVGNHTWTHMKLQGAAPSVIQGELERTDSLLQSILGEGVYWVRPPYGLINEKEKKLVSVPMVHWSVDPTDWDLKNTQKVVRAVLAKAKPGDIILLHDPCPTSIDAALQIIDTLEAQGYWFVTVEELLDLYGVPAQPGVLYRSARP